MPNIKPGIQFQIIKLQLYSKKVLEWLQLRKDSRAIKFQPDKYSNR